jgi:hypothetical protein
MLKKVKPSSTFLYVYLVAFQRGAPLSYRLASLTKQIISGISQTAENFKGMLRSGGCVGGPYESSPSARVAMPKL